MFWNKKKQPDFWKNYLLEFKNAYSARQAISALPFVVLDTKTSGLDPKNSQLLSIGAVSLQHNCIAINDALEIYLAQQNKQYNEAIRIHGILPEGKQTALPHEAALQELLSFLKNKIIIGHHIRFDIEIINQALKSIGCGVLKNKYFDVKNLAIRLEEGPMASQVDHRKFTLDALCDRYQVSMENRHTAVGDALITAILFQKILARLEGRGVLVLKDL